MVRPATRAPKDHRALRALLGTMVPLESTDLPEMLAMTARRALLATRGPRALPVTMDAPVRSASRGSRVLQAQMDPRAPKARTAATASMVVQAALVTKAMPRQEALPATTATRAVRVMLAALAQTVRRVTAALLAPRVTEDPTARRDQGASTRPMEQTGLPEHRAHLAVAVTAVIRGHRVFRGLGVLKVSRDATESTAPTASTETRAEKD
mmetsp:Transcript_13313/g.34026  ORF Transcript_13313/g.34026 Transcript_13313/m.34026 type:complete len:210 (-) Transcript_13313:1292-1921(-)